MKICFFLLTIALTGFSPRHAHAETWDNPQSNPYLSPSTVSTPESLESPHYLLLHPADRDFIYEMVMKEVRRNRRDWAAFSIAGVGVTAMAVTLADVLQAALRTEPYVGSPIQFLYLPFGSHLPILGVSLLTLSIAAPTHWFLAFYNPPLRRAEQRLRLLSPHDRASLEHFPGRPAAWTPACERTLKNLLEKNRD